MNSVNELVCDIVKRAKDLSEMRVDVLRCVAGYDCDTEAEAIRYLKGVSRGELIEIILTEEFCLEFDLEYGDEA